MYWKSKILGLFPYLLEQKAFFKNLEKIITTQSISNRAPQVGIELKSNFRKSPAKLFLNLKRMISDDV